MKQLQADEIRAPLSAVPREKLDDLEIFREIESTNSYLLRQRGPAPGRYRVAIAEHQTAGRGRLNRTWYSPPDSGICLSLAYTFGDDRDDLSSVPLAAGVGVADVLEDIGAGDVGLKWPNDVMVSNAKLGGILVEKLQTGTDNAAVVVGVGINVDLSFHEHGDATPPAGATDLRACCEVVPDRSALSAMLIESLFNTMIRFDADGFSTFRAAWQLRDWLRGRRISVDAPLGEVSGVATGIDSYGALLLDTIDGSQRIVSGSVNRIDAPGS